MSDRHRITVEVRPDQAAALEGVTDSSTLSVSEFVRRSIDLGLEHQDGLTADVDLRSARQEIKDQQYVINQAGYFADRVREQFTDRFLGGWSPKWLAAAADGYRKEARAIEQAVRAHPYAPDIEEGEMVEEVDPILIETVEAAETTAYDESLERFEGVADGRRRHRTYLAATASTMRSTQALLEATSASSVDPASRVPDSLDTDALPEGVTCDDVAAAARALLDRDVDPSDEHAVKAALAEYDPERFALRAGPSLTNDGDGAILDDTHDDHDDTDPDGGNQGSDHPQDDPAVAELVGWAATRLSRQPEGIGRAEVQRILDPDQRGEPDDISDHQRLMDQYDLTPTDIVELADDYLTLTQGGASAGLTATDGGLSHD